MNKIQQVVMNIVVAFVLESFMFRIQYRRQMAVEDIEGKGRSYTPIMEFLF